MHRLETAAGVIKPRRDEHPRLRFDLHGTLEHLQAFEFAATLIQENQVEGLIPKALHSSGKGRTDALIAAELSKNSLKVKEFPSVVVDHKDSCPSPGSGRAINPRLRMNDAINRYS